MVIFSGLIPLTALLKSWLLKPGEISLQLPRLFDIKLSVAETNCSSSEIRLQPPTRNENTKSSKKTLKSRTSAGWVDNISTLVLNFCKEKQEVEEWFLKLYTWLHHHGTYTPCGVLVPYPRNPVKETTDKRRLPET